MLGVKQIARNYFLILLDSIAQRALKFVRTPIWKFF